MAKHVDAERGMTWVRLESAFWCNPKVLQLKHLNKYRAISAYVGGLGYSGQQGLDGFIPDRALTLIDCGPRDATALVEVGMWHPIDGGYEINDWHDYQPTAEKVQQRRAAAKRNVEARWKRAEAAKLRAIE